MDNTNQYNYPSKYDIIQTLTEFSKRSFVDQFAQRRGIFLTKAVTSELANFLSSLFYEHTDIEELREGALKNTSSSTLSGFTYTVDASDSESPDPITAIERAMDSNDIDDGIKMSQLVKVTDEEGNEMYKGTVTYENSRPGRVQLLQKEERSFDFYIRPDGNKYTILADCNNSKDSKVLLDRVLKKHLPKSGRYNVLDIDNLTSIQTIKFFDELAKRGMDGDWEFDEVKQLIFRKGKEEEDDEIEAENTDLLGITQAILEGKNLRENAFVKQSENSGYRFTAMTYQFSNTRSPFVIEVASEFKGRPKVFEVSIKTYKQRVGQEEILENAIMTNEQTMSITSKLWYEAEAIYNELITHNLRNEAVAVSAVSETSNASN